MRRILAVTILAVAAGGCENKPQGPQTTNTAPPEPPAAGETTAGRPLEAIRPPSGEVASAEMAAPVPSPAPAPEPAPVISLPEPSPAPAPAAPAPAPARPKMYTIQRGDTFIGLARRFYDNPARWKDIAAANPHLNPNRLQIGQTIVLPE